MQNIQRAEVATLAILRGRCKEERVSRRCGQAVATRCKLMSNEEECCDQSHGMPSGNYQPSPIVINLA